MYFYDISNKIPSLINYKRSMSGAGPGWGEVGGQCGGRVRCMNKGNDRG